MTIFLVWVCGLCAVAVWMTLVWRASLALRNAGWVDLGWTLSVAGLNLYYLAAFGRPGLRGLALAFIVSLWGARLALHLTRRLLRERSEDPRYTAIRAGWEYHPKLNLFLLFQSQALVAAVLSLPFLAVHAVPGMPFGAWQAGGLSLWCLGFFGEALADRQLRLFGADPMNKGKVCQSGLWNYSRHPNYFFEWLMWLSYALFTIGAPYGWVGMVSPALMLFLLLKVSGVPPAEVQSLKSRGDAYRAYQRTTSVFVPWFKKGDTA